MKLTALLIILLIPFYAFSYTVVNGNLTRTTWSAGTYYITNNFTIAAGDNLTLNPGVVLKFAPGTSMSALGTLNANGAWFTSRNDNSVGDIIAESNGSPNPGDWLRLNVVNASSAVTLNNCNFRFGGKD